MGKQVVRGAIWLYGRLPAKGASSPPQNDLSRAIFVRDREGTRDHDQNIRHFVYGNVSLDEGTSVTCGSIDARRK